MTTLLAATCGPWDSLVVKSCQRKKKLSEDPVGNFVCVYESICFWGILFLFSMCFRFCMRTFSIIQYNQICPVSILKLDTPNAKQQKARSQMKEKDAKREYAIKICICAERDQKRLFLQTHWLETVEQKCYRLVERSHVTIIVLSWYYVRKSSCHIVIQELSVCVTKPSLEKKYLEMRRAPRHCLPQSSLGSDSFQKEH